MVRVSPVVLASLLAACNSDIGYTTLSPELSVLPASLDFGEVVANEATAALTVFVENGGRANLSGRVFIDGTNADQFQLAEGFGELEIEPDQQLEFAVAFVPTTVAEGEAALVFDTNDRDHPYYAIPLGGVGRVPYAPEIELSALSLDFGNVSPGDDRTMVVDVRNLGDAVLNLGTLSQRGAGAFELVNDYSGQGMQPGEVRTLLVRYTPTTGEGDAGTLSIASDDADEPVVEVDLTANGGAPGDYPEAAIDCPGSVDLRGPVVVDLDGSGSTDPNDLPLTYAWSIARRPAAADDAIAPIPADAVATQVTLDSAGIWEVQLQVTNSVGVSSAPSKCVIDAVPVDQLHVELSWGGATSDLDLHLADGEETPIYDVPGDVSWCNRNPDWGRAGQAEDDPSLDLDDDDGFGPENVNIAEPADGVYPVRVHLFEDADDDDVSATVSVFAHGVLIHTSTKVLRRNQVWDVGQVNWPDGTFGVSTARPYDAGGTRSCE